MPLVQGSVCNAQGSAAGRRPSPGIHRVAKQFQDALVLADSEVDALG